MIGFFEGRVTLCADQCLGAEILNLMMCENISCEKISVCDENSRFVVVLSERNASRLMCLCEQRSICMSVLERRGLPKLVRCYGKRVGIFFGLMVAALLVYASSQVVWDVRIEGNELLNDGEIRTMLRENGLDVGTYLPKFDNDFTEMQMLLKHREISWIAINIKGTTANVAVRETVRGTKDKTNAANLVAMRDGQIERIEAYDGNVCIKVGDVVRGGEVLVSGIYEGAGGIRNTRASGKIYARTVREFFVEIPLESEKKVPTGREWSENYINFFSKRIKVFANTGNAGGSCDIIYYDRHLTLPGGVPLPLGTYTVRHSEYRKETVVLDGEMAMEAAFSELERQLSLFVTETGAELLRKTVACELDESAYRIRCTVICVENIAVTKEMDIN